MRVETLRLEGNSAARQLDIWKRREKILKGKKGGDPIESIKIPVQTVTGELAGIEIGREQRESRDKGNREAPMALPCRVPL